MRLPATIASYEQAIEAKLSEFEDRLGFADVAAWVSQFRHEDQALAVRLFLNLRYFTSRDVTRLCQVLHSRLPSIVTDPTRNTLFVGVGGPADSGEMILYHYRITNVIPQIKFVDLDGLRDRLMNSGENSVDSVVFIDDFIGTGGEAIRVLSMELVEILQNHEFKYAGFHALAGFMHGVQEIKRHVTLDVEVAHLLTESDQVFHEASEALGADFFDRLRYKEIAKEYGRKLFPAGPLGYGDCQALVAFFYNTPNNTLPIIWSEANGWRPLLRRTDPQPPHQATGNEHLVAMYLALRGVHCSTEEIASFGAECGFDESPVIVEMKKRRLLSIFETDADTLMGLTPKGHRYVEGLLSDKSVSVFAVLGVLRTRILNTVGDLVGLDEAKFKVLLENKECLYRMFEMACTVRDGTTIEALHGIVSWLLLKENKIEERIALGNTMRTLPASLDLGQSRAYADVDDLGWSLVVKGEFTRAKSHLENGISSLRERQDYYGLCQGLRHLQGIKGRSGDASGAALGLRIVFGAACAIKDKAAQVHMQAGILRGLARMASKQGDAAAVEKLVDRSIAFSASIGGDFHARAEGETIRGLGADLQSAGSIVDGQYHLLLLRHPISIKNERQTFGRQLLTRLPEVGSKQITLVTELLSRFLSRSGFKSPPLYSGDSKVTLLLAESISDRIGVQTQVDASLNSIDSGELTGYTEADAAEWVPELYSRLLKYRRHELDGFDLVFPEGESVRDLTMRLALFLTQRVYSQGSPDCVVLIGHNSSITAIINLVTAIDRQDNDPSYRYFDVPLGKVMRVVIDKRVGGSASVECLE